MIPKKSSSTPRKIISSSPSWTKDSRHHSRASFPLSSALLAHKYTLVFRPRLYPSVFTCSVKLNMLAAGFSNVSNETLCVYVGGDVAAWCGTGGRCTL